MRTRRDELERFWAHVVKGPRSDDCWLWTGAVSDDGYGRFWTAGVDGGQRTIRPQRYAYRLATGVDLPATVLLLHRCDVPLCVHADANPQRSHVRPGTTRDNMDDRSRRGRARNGTTTLGMRGLARAERARRSRQLRDAIRDGGWDDHAIRSILHGVNLDDPTLW